MARAEIAADRRRVGRSGKIAANDEGLAPQQAQAATLAPHFSPSPLPSSAEWTFPSDRTRRASKKAATSNLHFVPKIAELGVADEPRAERRAAAPRVGIETENDVGLRIAIKRKCGRRPDQSEA